MVSLELNTELEDSKNRIPEKDLPTNLKDYSWAGHLARKVWDNYAKVIIWYYVIAGVISIGAGVGAEFIFDNVQFPVWALGLILWMWSGVGFPLVYQYFLIRKTFIFEWDEATNRRILHNALWFKNDLGKFSLNEAIYEKGSGKRYIFWWHDITKKEYIAINPYRLVDEKRDGRVSENNYSVTSADLAGITGWRDTVKVYAQKKNIGIQQLLQYSAFGIIIGIEVLGLFMLGNRVEEQQINATPTVTPTQSPNFADDGTFIPPN